MPKFFAKSLFIAGIFTLAYGLFNPAEATLEDLIDVRTPVSNGSVNLRSGPGTNYQILDTLPNNAKVLFCSQCVQEEVVKKDSSGCEWYSVYLKEKKMVGFIRSDFLYYSGSNEPVSKSCLPQKSTTKNQQDNQTNSNQNSLENTTSICYNSPAVNHPEFKGSDWYLAFEFSDTNKNTTEYFCIDRKSVIRQGNKVFFKDLLTIVQEKFFTQGILQEEYDCKQQQYRIVSLKAIEPNGDLTEIPLETDRYADIQPGTAAAVFYGMFCTSQ